MNGTTNIVIDLETFGTSWDSEIRSIGAATPDGTAFYRRQLKHTEVFTHDQETLDWWNKQCGAAREEVMLETTDAKAALESLATWLAQFPDFKIWGNSARFDLEILETAYKAYGLPVPWHYRQECCFRTLKAIAGSHIRTTKLELAVPHHALWDAKLEAIQLKEMLDALSNGS